MGQKNLDAAAKEVMRSGILRAERLRVEAGTASIEARGKHTSVVEDDEVFRAKDIGKFSEMEIFNRSIGSGKAKHAGSRAIGKSFLRDQLGRQFELKIGDEHQERL